MSNRIYLYVDGESHYLMSEKCWKKVWGDKAELSLITQHSQHRIVAEDKLRFHHHAEGKFFWDKYLPNFIGIEQGSIERRVYFTTFTGTPEGLHEARVKIRAAEFEPQVILEEKDLSKQRENRLKKDGLIIKAKGVDVALSVRMLEDAYNGNYDICLLATSDIDYLPVIEAVRRMGKRVMVFGYPEGIAKDSPFLYVPENFHDIGFYMNERYNLLIRSGN